MSMTEKKALKSAKDSYLYARDVLKGRFEKGEIAISKDTDCSKLYRENIYDAEKELEKEQKKQKKQEEKENKELEDIKKSITINCLYGLEV